MLRLGEVVPEGADSSHDSVLLMILLILVPRSSKQLRSLVTTAKQVLLDTVGLRDKLFILDNLLTLGGPEKRNVQVCLSDWWRPVEGGTGRRNAAVQMSCWIVFWRLHVWI